MDALGTWSSDDGGEQGTGETCGGGGGGDGGVGSDWGDRTVTVATSKDGPGGAFIGSGACDTNAVKASCDSRVSCGSTVSRGARHWSASGTPR